MKRIVTLFNLFVVAMFLLVPSQVLGVEDWFERGNAFLKSKRYGDAIKAFSEIIRTNPRDADAYNNRGVVWHHKGDDDRAIADYTKALDIDPLFSNAYNNRGVAWFHKGDDDRAIADYTEAVEINPRYANAYNNRGGAWHRKGEYGRAIADYTKALELNPNYANAYNSQAWILATCPDEKYRDGGQAVELAQKAVELDPGVNTLDTLAAAYAEVGRFGDAITTEERVLSLLSIESEAEGLREYIEHLESYKSHKPWREKMVKAPKEERLATYLESWRKAWESADLDAYLKFYHPLASQGRCLGKGAIAAKKEDVSSRKKPRKISFGPIQVSLRPGGLVVKFDQVYVGANGYRDRGRKTLVLAPWGQRWLIMDEKWSAK